MSADSPINLVFIVGSGRCGSSLVHELVSQHREAAFVSNFDDNFPSLNSKGAMNNVLFRSFLGKFTTKGRLRFAPSEAYHLIAKKVSPIYVNSCRNLRTSDVTPALRSSFRKFFLERYQAQRRKVFVHKYTGWSRVAFFKEIFPEAKFVHIVRDGRAVANSYLQMEWWTGFLGPEKWYLGELDGLHRAQWEKSGRSFLTLAGIAWDILVGSIEDDAVSIGDDSVMTLRYEDFLEAPAQEISKICRFCGLDFDRDIESRVRKSPIKSGRKQAYLQDLSESQVAELTECISGPLARYGYIDT